MLFSDLASATKVSGIVQLLAEGFLELQSPDIVPGEPVRFSWRFRTVSDIDGPRALTLRVLVDNQVVLERSGLTLPHITGQTMNEAITPPQHVGNVIYRFGRRTLKLQLFENLRSPPWREAERRFRVIPEFVDARWWNWRSAPFESVPWKKGYSLLGDFVNRSQYASVHQVTAELSEVRSEENPAIDPCDYLPVQVHSSSPGNPVIVPRAHAPFVFSLKHEWSWFLPAAYLFTGPINKTFAYAVWFYFNDQFGNSYAGRCSTRRSRHVGVSKGKRLAFASAQAAALAAASAGPFAFVYAGVMYGIASGFALIAKDPPEPDARYRERAELNLPAEHKMVDSFREEAAGASEFVRAALDIIGLEELRTTVRSRLLAARLMGDHEATELQLREYGRTEEQMRRGVERVRDAWPAAERAHAAVAPVAGRGVLFDSIGEGGMPPSAVKGMRDAGFDDAHIDGLAAILRTPQMREAAGNPELKLIRALALTIIEMTEELLLESALVRSGETYEHAAADDVDGDVQPKRRAGCGCHC